MNATIRTWLERFAGFGVALVALGGGSFLLLDRCIMPAYTRHGEEVFLPEVVGLPVEDALDTLRLRGIPIEKVDTIPSTQPPGTVVRQEPHGGMHIKEGRGVRLVVSGGETY